MEKRPILDKFFGRVRFHVALQDVSVEVEQASLSLIFSMEMWRIMLVMEHPDYNAKEHRHIRHLRFLRLGWALSLSIPLYPVKPFIARMEFCGA
jgi:hypothetical protein